MITAQEYREKFVDKKVKKNKYKARRTEVDGQIFHSKKEAERYVALKWLEMDGAIKLILRQVPFHLPSGIVYRADFMVVYRNGDIEFEDVKGFATKEYKLKKRLVHEFYGVDIKEV